jgi:3-hydroxyisobutyrate dehydrogenase-like beta-hydroxyacid dehydrogenase
MKVGFIGLGNMGSVMAVNLVKKGHTVTVYNRTKSRAEALRSIGARIADSLAEAAKSAEVIITMLSDDHALEEILFSESNAISAIPAGSIHVSMSTISVALSRRLDEAHRKLGQHYIAAPVFGRPEAAAAAKLFVVAAGPAEQVEACRPLFEAMGQKTFFAGEKPAQANVIKLSGNFMITAMIESLAQSVALIRKFGIDPNDYLAILTGSIFPAPIYQAYGKMIAADQFEPPGFKLPLGLKDNRLLLAAAEEASVPMPLANLVHDRFLAALAQGWSHMDWAAIARLSYRDAGL